MGRWNDPTIPFLNSPNLRPVKITLVSIFNDSDIESGGNLRGFDTLASNLNGGPYKEKEKFSLLVFLVTSKRRGSIERPSITHLGRLCMDQPEETSSSTCYRWEYNGKKSKVCMKDQPGSEHGRISLNVGVMTECTKRFRLFLFQR